MGILKKKEAISKLLYRIVQSRVLCFVMRWCIFNFLYYYWNYLWNIFSALMLLYFIESLSRHSVQATFWINKWVMQTLNMNWNVWYCLCFYAFWFCLTLSQNRVKVRISNNHADFFNILNWTLKYPLYCCIL